MRGDFMIKQLLLNRGFENGLTYYNTQGKVSDFGELANSGIKSALLLSSPTLVAEISQVALFIVPGAPVRFSFFARKFTGKDATDVSNIRAEVNFLSILGTTIPPGIVISIRGRDLGQNEWHCYEEYSEVPPGAVAAQVLIRLEPPAGGTSGILVDDLTLVSDVVIPTPPPPTFPTTPTQQGIPVSPSTPPKNAKPAAIVGIPCHENRYVVFKP